MSTDTVTTLADALAGLVAHIDRRLAAATEDDDVRALEDVASKLSRLPADQQARLRALMGRSVADDLGLADG
jgi:hypothetical protein